MTAYSEAEVRLAALAALNTSPTGTLTTTELKDKLVNFMNPDGSDATQLQNRNDIAFTQKVRNLVSHRNSPSSLMSKGLASYDDTTSSLTITLSGKSKCSI